MARVNVSSIALEIKLSRQLGSIDNKKFLYGVFSDVFL